MQNTEIPWPPDVGLRGRYSYLEMLHPSHAPDLADAARDLQGIWYTNIPTPDGMEAEIDRRLDLRGQGEMLPFAVVNAATGRAVGMTTYMHIDPVSPRIEIGSTWLGRAVQRTRVNTECKLMLLRHAFETLDCIAVELCTHAMNHQSRRAIERLGAKLDGIRRAHMRAANGTIRDTAVYSIIAPEWPAVQANLEWRLRRPR